MSKVVVSELAAPFDSNGTIEVASGDYIYVPGTVIQTVWVRSRTRTVIATAATGDGAAITSLNLTITPKLATSMMLVQWTINGEMHQDNVFTILQDSLLITTAGYEGYNNVAGNVRYSGFTAAGYDQNEDSTPTNWYIQYYIPAGSTASRVYAPAVRSSSAGVYSLALNRTILSAGQDAYEAMLSTGVVMEIAQ